MIEVFHFKKDIPFMSYGRLTTAISMLTFLASVLFLVIRPLNLSIEFTGGTNVELRFPQAVPLDDIRHTVENLHLGGQSKEVIVQVLDSTRDVLVRLPALQGESSANLSDKVYQALQATSGEATACAAVRQANATTADVTKRQTLPPGQCLEMRKVDFVGPSVGEELLTHGLTALAILVAGIVVYLAIRFEWRFAVAAIIANLHDVVIILGFFAFFQWEFSLTVLAAVLAVLGYSVNESVVVFDRIRENFRSPKMRGRTVPDIIDNAITTTMSRTVITHGSTEMMVLAMLLFGGSALHYFSLALTIGIVFGIYSSALVASPLLLLFGVTRENMIKPVRVKEEAVV